MTTKIIYYKELLKVYYASGSALILVRSDTQVKLKDQKFNETTIY